MLNECDHSQLVLSTKTTLKTSLIAKCRRCGKEVTRWALRKEYDEDANAIFE